LIYVLETATNGCKKGGYAGYCGDGGCELAPCYVRIHSMDVVIPVGAMIVLKPM